MPRKRAYPQVNLITDRATQQSVQLLWDKLFDALDDLDTARADLAAEQAQLALDRARLDAVELQQEENSIAAGNVTNQAGVGTGFPGSPGSGSGGGTTPPPGGGSMPGNDLGEGQAGLVQAGATGHLSGSFARNAFAMGQIVGGVGNEFPSLLAPAANQPARDANLAELLGRVIWHLQLNGFTAGKQQNPSGAISGDKFCAINQDNGITLVYDIFPGAAQDAFNNQFNLQMFQTWPAVLVPDGGVPD